MRYVFIEHDEQENEPVVVGPFNTESEARRHAGDRQVMALWSLDRWRVADSGAGWYIEPRGFSDTGHGPYADELDASDAMDDLGLSEGHWKIVHRADGRA